MKPVDGSQKKLNEETEADHLRQKEQKLDITETKTITDNELQKELKRFLIPKIRSASYRWAERSKAIKAARVDRGRYKCAMCHNSSLKNKEFVVDHKDPVVPIDGWDGNWDTYIKRMFVSADLFQILCLSCHEIKTNMEVQLRKIRREAKKKVDK